MTARLIMAVMNGICVTSARNGKMKFSDEAVVVIKKVIPSAKNVL